MDFFKVSLFQIKMFKRPLIKLFKGVSIGLTTGTGVASIYFLHKNDYELSSIGIVRFARAGIAVSFYPIIFNIFFE